MASPVQLNGTPAGNGESSRHNSPTCCHAIQTALTHCLNWNLRTQQSSASERCSSNRDCILEMQQQLGYYTSMQAGPLTTAVSAGMITKSPTHQETAAPAPYCNVLSCNVLCCQVREGPGWNTKLTYRHKAAHQQQCMQTVCQALRCVDILFACCIPRQPVGMTQLATSQSTTQPRFPQHRHLFRVLCIQHKATTASQGAIPPCVHPHFAHQATLLQCYA